jgi:BMFP domain-containing protein YqiC
MSENSSRILDELSRAVNGAFGAAAGIKREAEGALRAQIERILRDADIVSREEFEAVRAMAIAARDENERLSARLAALEAALPSEK